MGADSTLVFYGVRFETTDEEVESLQNRTDSRIVRARDVNLAHWWGSYSVDQVNERPYLFIGSLLGNIGHEGTYELLLTDQALNELIQRTKEKLTIAGFTEGPALYIQFEPDY